MGVNNKIFIPPNGIDKVIFPDKDNQSSIEEFAIRRTYTHAGMNLEKKEIYGFCSTWFKRICLKLCDKCQNRSTLRRAMKIQE